MFALCFDFLESRIGKFEILGVKKMTIMLLPCFILGLLMSESASQPSLQMCPNCKQVGRQALRYRGMRERFWGRTRVKDGKILEKITAKKEVVEKEKEE